MIETLITGHKGYIGSHIVDAFPGYTGCDRKDGQDFDEIRGEEIDTVIHLAAYVSVTESMQRPEDYLDNNFLKVARFLNNNRVHRFIFASTGGAMYGNAHQAREEQASWNKCCSPYAQSKYLAEKVIRDDRRNHVILRFANVYGGDCGCRGEAAVHAHFGTDSPIVVYGGEQTRDFIHIGRVKEAIIRAAKWNMIGTFNIGSGVEISIIGLAKSFSSMRGVSIDVRPSRLGEVDYISLDITKARREGLIP